MIPVKFKSGKREGGDVQFGTCSIGLAPNGGVRNVPGDSNTIPSRWHVPMPSH